VSESVAEQLQAEHGGRFTGALRRVSGALHVLAGAIMLLLLAVTVTDIIGRSFFANPLRGTVELTELAVVLLVYLGLAHAEFSDAHISVDLLYVRLGRRAQMAVRAFAGAVTLVVVGVLTWRLWVFTDQLEAGGYSTGVLRIPLHPVGRLAVLGSLAFGVAVLANLILALQALRKA
jgi:TRAP-type transport system small permease protein